MTKQIQAESHTTNSIDQSSEYHCEFVPVQNNISTGKHICQWCGRTATGDEIKEQFSCTGERELNWDGPSLAQKSFNFLTSFVKHIVRGCKVCTKSEIELRFEKCIPCDRYNKFPDPHGSCLECGCFVSTLRANEGLNKLAWAEQECPHRDGPKWHSVDSKTN